MNDLLRISHKKQNDFLSKVLLGLNISMVTPARVNEQIALVIEFFNDSSCDWKFQPILQKTLLESTSYPKFPIIH